MELICSHCSSFEVSRTLKGTPEDSAGLCTCPVFIFNLDSDVFFSLFSHSLVCALQTRQKWFNISFKMESMLSESMTQMLAQKRAGFTLQYMHKQFQHVVFWQQWFSFYFFVFVFFALIKNWSLANRNNVPLLSTVFFSDRNECVCWFPLASRFNTLSRRWM